MQIFEGQILTGICCHQFGWKVIVKIIDWWGVCLNPDCPIEQNNSYHGVDHFDEYEIEERTNENHKTS